MSLTIQWCDGPSPSVKRPSQTAWFDERLLRHRDRVAGLDRHHRGAELDASRWPGPSARSRSSASKSSGTCGTQIEVKPAGLRRLGVGERAARPCRGTRPLLGADHQADPHLVLLPRPPASAATLTERLRRVAMPFSFGRVLLAQNSEMGHTRARTRLEGSAMSRVAVVTGAASGMGLAVAQRLAADGHRVALLDLDGDAAHERRRAICGRRARSASASRSTSPTAPPSTRRWRRSARELGPIEIIVTSAGFDEFQSFTDITIEAWERMLAVNLTGTFHCLQAAIPDMVDGGLGPDRDDLVVERAVGRGADGALRRVEGRRRRAHQGAGASSTRRTASP